MNDLLSIDALRAGYGNIEVLHDVSLALREGTLCAIVGANGAGKTTLLMALAGILPVRCGHVRFDGADITRISSHERVRRGLVLVPEGRRMLAGMTVEENLQVAAGAGGAEGFARIPGLLDRFPILRTRGNVAAGSLSGGEQQMLAIARVLRAGARTILLDEPTEGLAPVLVERIGELIRAMKADGMTILLVEQNLRFATGVADRHHIVDHGTVVQTLSNTEVMAREGELLELLGV